jgi:hypothetical protein
VVLACAGLGLFLRLFFLSADALTEEEARTWARLAAGARDAAGRPELRALLAAPFAALGAALSLTPETVLRGTPALAGAAGVVAAAFLARRLFGALAGMFAAALFAVAPALLGADRAGGHLPLVDTLALCLCLCAAEVAAPAEGEPGSPEARHRALWFAGATLSAAALGLLGRWGLLAALVPAALLVAGTPRPALRSALPLAAAALGAALGPHLFGALEAPCEYTFGGVLYSEYGEAPSPLLHFSLALVKLGPGTLVLALGGALALAGGARLARPDAAAATESQVAAPQGARLVLAWLAVVALVLLWAHPLWPEESVLLLPPLLLLAAAGAAALVERLRGAGGLPTAASSVALLACALAGPGAEAFAAASTAPHPRMWLSPLAALGGALGKPPLLAWSPTSEIGTTGLREAAVALAGVERNAEVASDQPESLRLLLAGLGREDLSLTTLVRGRACRAGRVCYALLQEGRAGSHACAAGHSLSARAPWHEEKLLGLSLVRIYRLGPGESPYPDENVPR